ncbi:MAG: rod shape-determining protein MreC [Anaerolineae bacterium]
MRRNWFANRLALLGLLILISMGLIGMSALGVLRPIEDLLASPLNWITALVTEISTDTITRERSDEQSYEQLAERTAELERQLAQLQGELVTLREIDADYDRLTELLGYVSSIDNMEFVTADVIGRGQYGFVNSIIINKGTRDGLTVGMPIVTDLGLIGRVWRVTSNTAQVQLITDRNSYVSSRLQDSRAEGTVQGRGLATGTVEMLFISLDVEISPGELVYTSGLGGNFPADLPIGQVVSISNVESELTQSAQISSLVDFTTLEQVLVVINFRPVNISVFDAPEGQ